MKVKIFSDDLQNDSTVKKLKKHYDKKQKDLWMESLKRCTLFEAGHL